MYYCTLNKCALAHVLYIKSPFNLIVLKGNVLNLWIRLLTFSVSKCHTSVDKEALTSILFHHFEAWLYFIPFFFFLNWEFSFFITFGTTRVLFVKILLFQLIHISMHNFTVCLWTDNLQCRFSFWWLSHTFHSSFFYFLLFLFYLF